MQWPSWSDHGLAPWREDPLARRAGLGREEGVPRSSLRWGRVDSPIPHLPASMRCKQLNYKGHWTSKTANGADVAPRGGGPASIVIRSLLASSRQLHDGQPGHDEHSREEASHRQWLTKDHDTDNEGADGTDARPYGIGRAQRKGFHRERQQREARQHHEYGESCRPWTAEALRELHRVGPDDLQKTGGEQIHPGHFGPSFPKGPGRP